MHKKKQISLFTHIVFIFPEENATDISVGKDENLSFFNSNIYVNFHRISPQRNN